MSNLNHRKSTKTIKVTDINGMPVKNAKLRLLQKRYLAITCISITEIPTRFALHNHKMFLVFLRP